MGLGRAPHPSSGTGGSQGHQAPACSQGHGAPACPRDNVRAGSHPPGFHLCFQAGESRTGPLQSVLLKSLHGVAACRHSEHGPDPVGPGSIHWVLPSGGGQQSAHSPTWLGQLMSLMHLLSLRVVALRPGCAGCTQGTCGVPSLDTPSLRSPIPPQTSQQVGSPGPWQSCS